MYIYSIFIRVCVISNCSDAFIKQHGFHCGIPVLNISGGNTRSYIIPIYEQLQRS